MLSFSITSNSGREDTTFRLPEHDISRAQCTLGVQFTAHFWDKGASLTEAELVLERAVTIQQVHVEWRQLDELHASLREWLHSATRFDTLLADNSDCKFKIQIGATPKLISSVEKPAFSLSYEAGAMANLSWRYVVDQSCIRIFYDGLTAVLARRGAERSAESMS